MSTTRAPCGPFDRCLPDVPLPRQRPVEDLRARRQLPPSGGDVPRRSARASRHAVPGEAARDRKSSSHQPVELAANGIGLGNGGPVDRHGRAGPGGASP